MRIVASERGLQRLVWSDEPSLGPDALLAEARRQLDEYFAGDRRGFELPLDPAGTPFQQRAWRALGEVPFGETRTYAAQALQLGLAHGARAIGSANARNPLPVVIPCHRLVGTNGALTGYAGGLDRKAWLLRHEGCQIVGRSL